MAKTIQRHRPRTAGKRHAALIAQAYVFVLAAKAKKGQNAGKMLADPEKMEAPPVTPKLAEARTFVNRTSTYKFFKRNPGMSKKFDRQRVPLAQ